MANFHSGKNIALLVGCNYQNIRKKKFRPLSGCHNDVDAVHTKLIEVFGFNPNNIEVLKDELGTKTVAMPTGAMIKKALQRSISQLRKGDTLYFHFSGHGTSFPYPKCYCKKSPSPECCCRKVEAIVACDLNFITNMDLRKLVNGVPQGATFWFFSDSCHSGGLMDKEKEQIRSNSSIRKGTIQSDNFRSIPYEIVLDVLCETLSMSRDLNNMSRDVGTIMLHTFGSDASLLFSQPRDGSSPAPLKPAQGILLSACRSDERAYECLNDKRLCFGVFTLSFLFTIEENLPSPHFTNKQLVTNARKIITVRSLPPIGQTQHPCLYCSDDNANRTYLSKSNPASISGKNMALLVGCNKPNSKFPNCHNNNVSAMHKILITEFGFDKTNIEVLTENPGTKPGEIPTSANIKSALNRLISQLQAGHVLFLYFTGPGTAIDSPMFGSETLMAMVRPQLVEAIVTCDNEVITNTYFREQVNRVPDGATFTFLADCNHSGGLIDGLPERIGPNTLSTTYMPRPVKQDRGILLSACLRHESAMDCEVGVKQCMGAFTHAVQVIIQENMLDRPFTNMQLVMTAREILTTRILKNHPNERQHPSLYCSDKNANHYFLNNLPKK